ncbi:glycosyltransferase [Ruficoccus sp. ZRK36]|uniref:glycosyltransferase n=1 Tax=Ruficoccus sp. ZRK36 TaxID=2866311 RepID=UPI001C73A003|nr:glycosyltransferase [Ruficoccus sp. ZRK36]QYY35659.1 glycosyltransferase [Ruficoccus sp. ZRK36]
MAERILIIGPSHPFRGGIATYSTLLYDTLRRRCQVDFFGLKRQFWKFLYPGRSQIETGGFNLAREDIQYRLDTYNPFSWLSAGRQARDYDAVILPWWVAFWLPFYAIFLWASRGGRAKRILLCHNVQDHEAGLLTRIATDYIYNRADAFIVQSEDEAERLKRILRQPREICIHAHPSYAHYNRDTCDRASARDQLGLGPEERVALFFGYVRDYKGVDVLIEAAAQLRDENLPVKCLVVGEIWKNDPKYAQLIERLNIGDQVKLIDRYIDMEEIEPYFKAADFCLLPYRSATGSGVLQVALGMGTPAIASDLPAFSGSMTDEEEGFLVPPGDAQALASAIRRMYEADTHLRMAEHLRNQPPDQSWEELADKLFALLERTRQPSTQANS